MALKFHSYPYSSPRPFLLSTAHSHHHSSSSSSSQLFGTTATRPKHFPSTPFSCAASPNQNNLPAGPTSPSIFLSSLQSHEAQEEEEGKELELLLIKDPILKFFKSRSSSSQDPDPPRISKFSLQRKTRRTSWHLSPTLNQTPLDQNPLPQLPKTEPDSEQPLVPQLEGIVGEILQLARNLTENSTLPEHLGPYEGKIGKSECVEVLGYMGQEEGLIISCLHFFEWMGLQEPSLVTPQAYSVLFPLLGRAAMGDKVMVLFDNLPNDSHFRDALVYNAAILALLFCRRYGDAWKVYEIMETNNIQPDDVTCSIMITIMRRRGNSAKDAWNFFEKMNRKGVKWSVEVMGGLMKAFCDEGLKKEALIIQSEMEKKGIPSNAVIYNTLTDAYSKSNQVEEAEGLFSEMRSNGIAPTAVSYNILMDAYSRRMQPEIVEKLMLEMENEGLQPCVKSFICLISAYGRQRKMSDMAANAFLKMKKVGIKPTSHSYTALIHAYSVDGWHEKAYLAFDNMQRERIKPSVETYTALLDASRRAGDTEKLMRTWKMMRADKVEGTRVTFNILMDGFAKHGHYVEARDVIYEFGKIGFQPM